MKIKIISLLLSSGMVLAACGQDDGSNEHSKKTDDQKPTEQKQSGDTSNTSQTGKNNHAIKLNDIKTSPEDAVKTAKKEYQGEVKEISFEKEQGKWAYKVDLQKQGEEAEVVIDDNNAKVINQSTEKEDDYNKEKSFEYKDFKPYKEVIKTAQDKFAGDIHEWSLSKDDDQGKFVYDIDLEKGNQKQEFTIDAKTGKILKQNQD